MSQQQKPLLCAHQPGIDTIHHGPLSHPWTTSGDETMTLMRLMRMPVAEEEFPPTRGCCTRFHSHFHLCCCHWRRCCLRLRCLLQWKMSVHSEQLQQVEGPQTTYETAATYSASTWTSPLQQSHRSRCNWNSRGSHVEAPHLGRASRF